MSFLPRLQVDALHRRPPSQRKGTSTWLACCAKEASTTRSHLGGLRLKDTGISQTRSLLSPWPSRACCQLCLGRSFEPKLVLLPASPGCAGRLPGLLPLLRGPARGAPPGGMAGLVQLQRGPHLLALRQESRTALRGQAGASATPWCLGRAIPSVRGVCAKKSHRKHHMEPFGIPRTPVLSRDVVEIECWAQVRPNRPSLPRL